MRAIVGWWVPNRPHAPDLFAAEPRRVCRASPASPDPGRSIAVHPSAECAGRCYGGAGITSTTPSTRGEGLITVRAVWHAGRGTGPALP